MAFHLSFLGDCQKKIVELQKRVTETGKNVLLRTQRWQRISTGLSTTCDVVLTFSQGTQEEHIQWFIELLHTRVPELVVQLHKHRMSGQSALYLTACFRDLLMGAEVLGIRKPLAPEHGGGLREFSMEELDLFDGATDETSFLSSGERSYIVYNYLMSLCAREGDTWADEITFNEGQPLIRSLQSVGFIHQIFPVHQVDELKQLKANWVRGWNVQQPLEEIRRYFGAQIALYFAWLGHYTTALLFPSVVGLLVFLFVSSKDSKFYYLVMGFLSLIWSTIYLEHWKRTSTVLTHQWGIWDAPPALLEEPRAAFKGKLTKCPITGRLTRTYPAWRRTLILFFFTGPVVLLSLVAVVLVTFAFVRLQEHADAIAHIEYDSVPLMFLLWYAPKVLLAVVILLMDLGYRRLATWLTDLENHRLDREYHNHLVGKLLLLQFMNSFYSLFYTAFYLQDIEMLQQQLSTLLITRQIISNMREVFLPYGQSRVRQFLLSFRYERQKLDSRPMESKTISCGMDSHLASVETLSGQPVLDAANTVRRRNNPPHLSPRNSVTIDESPITPQELEATLLPYDGPDDDFLEMFIQFGYVSMFSCVFPAAGVLALLNNLIEIRGDAFKLTASFQRPFIQSANDIGIWQLAMSFMGYAAVIVNVGLLNVSGAVQDLFPQLDAAQSILLLVVVEHCIFVLYYALAALIPDTPSSVLHQIAKLEHRRREALRTLERESMREYRRHRSSSRTKQTDIQAANEISG
ncbi:hypothetical protein EG68_02706 [Paragonimus skrjabini miyazakii]|uniref:Anoctamin n=1 Tax=Paragonimus skrjabini miyazakii TaxID=59628 RepID=A0A8S9YY87_9TREM|nr:hypothetical protein EG68_02706 [Paragonimus skrjabini miyazakii]